VSTLEQMPSHYLESPIGKLTLVKADGALSGLYMGDSLEERAEGPLVLASIRDSKMKMLWRSTRLVASIEANAHDEYKRRIVKAAERSTAHTTLFGPEWPAQRIHVLRNRVVREWAGREDQVPNPPPPPAVIGHTTLMPNSVPGGIPNDMPKFSAMLPTQDTIGDFEEMCMPAGEGVRVIKGLQPAAQIVADMMMEGARAVLEEQFAGRTGPP
jgi:NAD(P)H-dependent flavin oxidoreductase YrpB (nitropropane dioxygenase family)